MSKTSIPPTLGPDPTEHQTNSWDTIDNTLYHSYTPMEPMCIPKDGNPEQAH